MCIRDREYIVRKNDAYEENEPMTANELMESVESKFKTLVENKQFKKLTPTEEKIVAMQAQLKKQDQQLKDKRLTISNKLLDKLNKGKQSHKEKKMVVRKTAGNRIRKETMC